MIKINKGEKFGEFEFDLKGNLPRLMAEMGLVMKTIFLLMVKKYGEENATKYMKKIANESVEPELALDVALIAKLKELGYIDEN